MPVFLREATALGFSIGERGSGPLPTPPTPLDPRMCLMQLEPLSLRLTQPMKAGVFIVLGTNALSMIAF